MVDFYGVISPAKCEFVEEDGQKIFVAASARSTDKRHLISGYLVPETLVESK